MAVLVLGGAGYIGSHVARALLDSGEETAVADNLRTGHRQAVPPGADFHQGDVRDGDFLDRVFRSRRFSTVMHFAASSLVGESVREPLAYYGNNLGGAMAVLEAMIRHETRDIVFSSTAAVYGTPKSIPIPEEADARPANPYGETKLAVERMLEWLGATGSIRYAALRYFNAAGAHPDGSAGEDHDPETHLIPLTLQAAMGIRNDVGIYGDDYPTPDGTCIRDYIHVIDLAEAHLLAARRLAADKPGGVFNLGNGVGFSVRQVIDQARAITGRDIRTRILPRRPGDPDRLVASNAKAERELGFRPVHSGLEEIIASAWKWRQGHPHGFRG